MAPPLESLDLAGVAVRLMGRYRVSDKGCWEWTGAVNDGGYGILRIGGKSGRGERCHRVAYVLWVGPIGPGRCVLHHCDNRRCFRPAHLFLGTMQDNTDDMHRKGRWRKPAPRRGEKGTRAKLTEPQVRDALDRIVSGETRTSVAARLGVTISTISRITRGSNWKHVTSGMVIPQSRQGVRRHG